LACWCVMLCCVFLLVREEEGKFCIFWELLISELLILLIYLGAILLVWYYGCYHIVNFCSLLCTSCTL
jgi:hypothetical protein